MTATSSPLRLLVGEDDESLREMVSMFFQKRGYQVVEASDGEVVEHTLKSQAFDMLLLDVMMPKRTGFDVLSSLRARGDRTPVIMTTAVATPDEIVRALENGADDYVTKPYSLPVLLARVELRARQARAQAAHTSDLDVTPPAEPPKHPGETGPSVEVVDADVVELSEADQEQEHDERSFLSRLRSAADVFRRRKETQITIGPGAKLGERYLLGSKIGEGGFGVVFEARHLDLDQPVAVKVLRPTHHQTSFEQFKKEAQKASRVRHDHAVRVLDFGIDSGRPYFVMELLSGISTEDELVMSGPFELVRAISTIRAVLQALACAHAEGIVHRDVKPQNIVLHQSGTREIPKLLDFGIAKSSGEAEAAGVLVGSAAYIAPERIKGKAYDGRADVYAAGLVLYRLLTGALPFPYHVDDFENIAKWHLHGETPAVRDVRPEVPIGVDRVLARLTARDPHVRPTAEEAESLLEQLIWDASF